MALRGGVCLGITQCAALFTGLNAKLERSLHDHNSYFNRLCFHGTILLSIVRSIGMVNMENIADIFIDNMSIDYDAPIKANKWCALFIAVDGKSYLDSATFATEESCQQDIDEAMNYLAILGHAGYSVVSDDMSWNLNRTDLSHAIPMPILND